MEELLRQAFQLGQQWVQDMNNDKEPKNFNEWYASDEVQQQVKNCSIPAVVGRSEQLCPKCDSDDLFDIDDHYTKCQDCGFSFVGA